MSEAGFARVPADTCLSPRVATNASPRAAPDAALNPTLLPGARVILVDYQMLVYDPEGSAERLSELLPCIGPLDANVMPDRRLMGVKSAKTGGRAETLLHFSRTTPLAAANKLVSVDGAAGPSLRALGYLPQLGSDTSGR